MSGWTGQDEGPDVSRGMRFSRVRSKVRDDLQLNAIQVTDERCSIY